MNVFSKMMCGLAALTLFAACSSEDAPKGDKDAKGGVFATLTLDIPGSRSLTNDSYEGDDREDQNSNSNAGFEIGQDFENHVGSVLVVLATSTDGTNFTYLTHSMADGQATGTENFRRTYKVTFQNEALLNNLGQQVYVFAYCNPTDALKADIQNLFPNGIGSIADADNAEIWESKRFLMSNRDLRIVTLPTQQQIADVYHDAEHPFPLGTVIVERLASRFDFKEMTVEGMAAANTYPIKEMGTNNVMANVRFDALHMFNIAKEYYYLPHTGDYNASNVVINEQLCGAETSKNWIISPNNEFKLSPVAAQLPNYYFYALGVDQEGFDPTGLTFTSFSEIAAGTEDDDENWTATNGTKEGYHIWRYATENTLPGIEQQLHAVTTGVVFRAFIEAPTAGSALATAMEGKNTLYALNGTLYGDASMVKAYMEENPVSLLKDEWTKAVESAGNVDADGNPIGRGNSQLTIYRYDDTLGGYPVYYYYYNRHNSNNNPIVMHTMEFATVRNNVYKLFINSVKYLGHPGDPGDDPDPEDPDDPDESSKTYFEVNLQVLPWVVRVNGIDF